MAAGSAPAGRQPVQLRYKSGKFDYYFTPHKLMCSFVSKNNTNITTLETVRQLMLAGF